MSIYTTSLLEVEACDKPHYPYQLPEGWAWCKLEDIAYDFVYGTSEKSLSEGLVPVLRMGNINRIGEIDWNNLVYTSNQTDIAKYSLKQDDLLFNRTNSSEWVGKTAIYKGNRNAIYAGYIIRIRTISVNADYINYVMNSSYHRDWCNEVKTDAVNQSNINAQKLSQLYIPIPPYKEQQRIFNSVQRWITIIDNIEKGKCYLALSVAETKSKILDLAIHGKLVPQDPTDEPASELLKRINPKAEIACDNGQYQKLPKGWCLCLLNDVLKEVFAGGDKPFIFSKNKSEENYIPIYANGTENKGLFGFTNKAQVYERCLTISARGTIGFTCIREVPFVPIVRLITAIPLPVINLLFLKHQIDTMLSYTEGSSIPQLTIPTIKRMLIILPPLKEQLRIVAKIEELFALLDTIKAQL